MVFIYLDFAPVSRKHSDHSALFEDLANVIAEHRILAHLGGDQHASLTEKVLSRQSLEGVWIRIPFGILEGVQVLILDEVEVVSRNIVLNHFLRFESEALMMDEPGSEKTSVENIPL